MPPGLINEILNVLAVVLLGGLGWLVRNAYSIMLEIRLEMLKINGRLGKIEQWQVLHGEEQTRRFHEVEDDVRELQQRRREP